MTLKVDCLKELISRRPRALFRGELFFAAWEWVRLHLLPEPHCLGRPQKPLAMTPGSQQATLLCSGSQQRQKYSRPTFGSNTTNSAAFRMPKFLAALGMKL